MTDTQTYEEARQEYEQIVRSLEQGGLSLDGIITRHARGKELHKICTEYLTEADNKIKEAISSE